MYLESKNKADGIEAILRPFRPEDAEQLIACVRDAYGETYVKPWIYSVEGILHHVESGEMHFSVAEVDGVVAGMTACEVSEHFPQVGEIACQIIRQEYSGYGLALPLALHAMHQGEQMPLKSQFARALGCHLISQKTLKSMGFTACGFLLHIFDKKRFLYHFENGDYAKVPQSVAFKRQEKTEAGNIWMPEELMPLAEHVYSELGVSWSRNPSCGSLAGKDIWARELDEKHATLTLWARSCGADFETRLDAEISAVAENPGQTVNLYLNLSCPGSGAAYEAACKRGFFFTGFFPCGADGEYMILHHPLQVPVLVDTIPHIPEYTPFMEQIRRQLCRNR